ncbi:hypothetical protein ACU4GI_33395 [Cupriavidus basilensis]
MGMQMDAEAGDKLIEGTEGCHAVLHAGSDHIEVWCEEFVCHYGNVQAGFTGEQINVAVRFYRMGEKHGEDSGRRAQQREIQRVMGLG